MDEDDIGRIETRPAATNPVYQHALDLTIVTWILLVYREVFQGGQFALNEEEQRGCKDAQHGGIALYPSFSQLLQADPLNAGRH